jgi:ribosomal protein S18 acetylase RimI-like enzyme
MDVVVRRVAGRDIERLSRQPMPAADRRHQEARWALQVRGEAAQLLAWQDQQVVGWVTLLVRSKYDEVRELLGDFPEMNALAARPPGRGIGTALIRSAEDAARESGAGLIGLAVGEDNEGAVRLYDRLGYTDWGHGPVVDRWTEYDDAGHVVQQHASPCAYLVKPLPPAGSNSPNNPTESG